MWLKWIQEEGQLGNLPPLNPNILYTHLSSSLVADTHLKTIHHLHHLHCASSSLQTLLPFSSTNRAPSFFFSLCSRRSRRAKGGGGRRLRRARRRLWHNFRLRRGQNKTSIPWFFSFLCPHFVILLPPFSFFYFRRVPSLSTFSFASPATGDRER